MNEYYERGQLLKKVFEQRGVPLESMSFSDSIGVDIFDMPFLQSVIVFHKEVEFRLSKVGHQILHFPYLYKAFKTDAEVEDFAHRVSNFYHDIKNDNLQVIDCKRRVGYMGAYDCPALGYIFRPENTVAESFDGNLYMAAAPNALSEEINYHIFCAKEIIDPIPSEGIRSVRRRADALLPVSSSLEKWGIKSLIQPQPGEYYVGKYIWVYPKESVVFVLTPGGWIHLANKDWPKEAVEEFEMWRNLQ